MTKPAREPRSKPHDVTQKAAAFYAGALKDARPECCGPAAPALAPDYEQSELANAPEDAVANSFGCGNPVSFAAIEPGQTVLDLGSGAGLDLILAAERAGPEGRVIGLDVSPEMIERATANARAAGATNIELRRGIMEDMPVEAGTVDWVISNCVINLSPDKAKVFGEVYRVLKPGGHMLVSDIIADDVPGWILANDDLYSACLAGALPGADYLGAARGAGLKEVDIVDKLTFDSGMLAALIRDELPVALDELCGRLNATTDEIVDRVTQELNGKVHSVKVAGRRPKA